MDEIVKAALKKWPNVPHCWGWLALDARGNWSMRDERVQRVGPFPQVKGSRIDHEGLLGFIARNAIPAQHRQLQPAPVGPVAGGPQHRLHVGAQGQLQAWCRRHLRGSRPVGFNRFGRQPVAAPPVIQCVEQALHLQVGQRAHVAQRSREQRAAVAHAGQPAHHLHAQVLQRVQVQRST